MLELVDCWYLSGRNVADVGLVAGECVGDGIRWSGSGCLIDETGAGSGCFEPADLM